MTAPWTSADPREWTQAEIDASVYWHPAAHRAITAAVKGSADIVAIVQAVNSSRWVPARPDYRMPPMWDIAVYWHQRDEWFAVDLERPECFACSVPGQIQDGPLDVRWNRSGRLERGHLVNRIRHGLDYPPNLVPLCAFCNRNMPVFNPDQAQEAIDWVLSGGATARLADYIRKYEAGET